MERDSSTGGPAPAADGAAAEVGASPAAGAAPSGETRPAPVREPELAASSPQTTVAPASESGRWPADAVEPSSHTPLGASTRADGAANPPAPPQDPAARRLASDPVPGAASDPALNAALPPPQDAAARRLDFSGARLLAADPADASPPDPAAEPALPPPDACALLTGHSFGDVALLVPDTAGARPLALETIRAHHRNGGRPKRRDLLVLAGGQPLPPEFAADAEVVALSDDPGAVEAAITPRTAGLWIAPFRRAAGLVPVDGGLLATLRTLADDYGLPLVFDETDAGLGRTGMAFAHEWRGVTPDLMLVGEGAGLPLAALVLSARHARALPPSRPPVDAAQSAAAGAMLAAVFAEGFEARIQALGWLLEDRLATLRYGRPDLFREVAGLGLAQGLACTGPAAPLAQALAARGLDVAVFGDVLAFLPPLDVSEADITAAADILDAVVAERVPEDA